MNSIEDDPVIDEIREVRHRISERFDHDPDRLVAYYMELQKSYADWLLGTSKVPEQKGQSAASFGQRKEDESEPNPHGP